MRGKPCTAQKKEDRKPNIPVFTEAALYQSGVAKLKTGQTICIWHIKENAHTF
jgi:hypothetical protein